MNKLDKWADLLLDTGKRNNLINFKDTKMGTAEILSPDLTTLFSACEHSAVFEVYDPKLEEDDELEAVIEDKEIVGREEWYARYGGKLKKNQILVFNTQNKPLSALKNVNKRAQSAIEETGVNIAYIALGFIRWTENEKEQQAYRAPILLVPITLENESPITPHYVKVMGDEIILNPTFAFKLQHEYGIELPQIGDDEGVVEYFARLQELFSKLRWTVTHECKIGIFSFLKINMYKDLKDNLRKIVSNDNVKALLGSVSVSGEEKTEEVELHNVVDADSSQSEAINMAINGNSFVLQGPPGTGKSQTITNIIAECLLAGKKVLFVSEKLAALNVVYDKLKGVGLDDFCLELHSHKANKRQVIDELCDSLKKQKSTVSEKAEREILLKKDAQRRLDEYVEELHKNRDVINKTLYQAYQEIASCNCADVNYLIRNIKAKGEEYIDKALNALDRYGEYIPSIGYDYHDNAWYGYCNEDCTYERTLRVKDDLLALSGLGKELKSISDELGKKYLISIPSLAHAHAFERFFGIIKNCGFVTPQLLDSSKAEKALRTIKIMQELAREILDLKASIDADCDEDIYQMDGQGLYKKLTKQYGGFFVRLFSREYKTIISNIRLCRNDGKKPKYSVAVATVDNLKRYQQKSRDFASLEKTIIGVVGGAYSGVNTDFEACIRELEGIIGLKPSIDCGRLAKYSKSDFVAQKEAFSDVFNRLSCALTNAKDSEERILDSWNEKEYVLSRVSLESFIYKMSACYENIEKIDNWCSFLRLLRLLEELDLREYVDFAISKTVDKDKIKTSFKRAFYIQWVDLILHETPALMDLGRVPHDETVKRFAEKDRLQFEINKAKIKASLSAQRPGLDMVAQGSGISILLRESEKKRKQKGIRTLLSEIGELAQTLKPCFLMSPLSVSTYLSPDMSFDVVIFDEASQIFPQDAVGAIYRGKQLVVVGDSKQMPPSNFFNTSVDIDQEDEDEDVTDFESILDLCSTSFPQRRLKWHYRSRFEQLIAFSNKNFYDNELVTFPSARINADGVGVDYIYAGGTFDRRTKTNRVEAEKIVDMVFEHFEKYPDRSLGVVAFSVAQQTLIDKLISKRRRWDTSKEEFFRFDKEEPFFVKNLETVQGDERDTVIFSVAYAKDEQGRILANFGPVNREGGERRLNVAITRAKYNVKLVASMHYSDIDLSGSKSVGARLLREYLDYAENGNLESDTVIQNNAFTAIDFDFEKEVGEFVRGLGYDVERQVGCSAFKIDLAVKKPDSSDYLLAIECDGVTYRESKSTRDRDRLRRDILERMGWKFYRVWSVDWFRNKRVEKERLSAYLKSVIEGCPQKKTKEAENVTFEELIREKPFAFPTYPIVDDKALCLRLKNDKAKIIQRIVSTESPIAEEWLLKRIVFIFGGREKITNVVREEYELALRKCMTCGVVRKNGFLYYQNAAVPMLRVPADEQEARELKYICVEELAKGLEELLKLNVTAQKSGLFKLLVSKLGFARMGEAMEERLEQALRLIASKVEINGDVLVYKQD